MSRRLRFLASFILFLFVVVAAQSAYIQFFQSEKLASSPLNPRISQASTLYARGEIVAADGTILAQSVPVKGPYPWQRIYPLGSLTSGVVGFSSPSYGVWGLEAQYDSFLSAHAQPPQSLAQLLAPSSSADTLNLTIEPALQTIARNALACRDGAAVFLDPRNGAVLAMYSNPNYNPTPLVSSDFVVAAKAWKSYTTKNANGFPPLGLMATQQTFPPGSTFKVVTTAAAVIGRPDLLSKPYPVAKFARLPGSNKLLYNSGGTKCGGTIAEMLPASCDPGYALLGMDLGGSLLAATANAFGFNDTPPLDLPGTVRSFFPDASVLASDIPQLAYSSIGQQNVRATALQDALVAASIANGGVMMAPHLMSFISSSDGSIVKRFKNSVWKNPLTQLQASQIVPLMQNVVRFGTASGIFLAQDDVAAKTGTAQTGNSANNTDTWMIAFAPALHPTIAVAVVVPFQPVSAFGSTVAGPITKCLVEGALALQKGLPTHGTSTTCPH